MGNGNFSVDKKTRKQKGKFWNNIRSSIKIASKTAKTQKNKILPQF